MTPSTIHHVAQTAARCLFFACLTAGATQALDTWDSEPAGGGGTGVLETPEDASQGSGESLSCGEESAPFDIPVRNYSTTSTGLDDAAFETAALELYREVGLGRPDCDSSNCGFGQSCPEKGGSQTISGGVKAERRTKFSLYVDLDVKPGTQGIVTCKNCY